ncbi:MAG: 3-deoxy-D-manno-octulosonic acid kinase [Gammaproteobacteria bacterium]|nr:3-deoxy-D-manno-octulosonic acid kinase [Gammaproteobacteria bacterium]
MTADPAHDPQERRLENERQVMLYDPSLAGNFDARWFDGDHWRAAAALRGSAPGRGSTVFFAADGREYALRHYRRGGLAARICADRYLDTGADRSRPIAEFRITQQLQRLGLPVAAVVAARYQPQGRAYRGDLITLRLNHVETLAALLLAAAGGGPTIAPDWARLGGTIARFHGAGLDHADLNAHNLLRDAQGGWHVIDFDRARFRRPGLWCDANLVRLRRSLLKVCDSTRRDFDERGWSQLLAGYREARQRLPAATTR